MDFDLQLPVTHLKLYIGLIDPVSIPLINRLCNHVENLANLKELNPMQAISVFFHSVDFISATLPYICLEGSCFIRAVILFVI